MGAASTDKRISDRDPLIGGKIQHLVTGDSQSGDVLGKQNLATQIRILDQDPDVLGKRFLAVHITTWQASLRTKQAAHKGMSGASYSLPDTSGSWTKILICGARFRLPKISRLWTVLLSAAWVRLSAADTCSCQPHAASSRRRCAAACRSPSCSPKRPRASHSQRQ